MKKEELMLGDWVLYKKDYCKVNVNTFRYIEQRKEFFSPIPITSTLLERNGFKNYGTDIYYLIEATFSISLCMEEGWWRARLRNRDELHQTRMDYIHELQHSLKICKINKEIKLC